MDDVMLVARLRRRDDAAFEEVVRRHHASMVRVARGFVPTDAVAEEVAQEAWLGVLVGLDRFEGRSSLKTWIFRILVNRARTRGVQEHRTVPFASLAGDDAPAVDPDRFLPRDHDRYPGHWAAPPHPFDAPEDELLTRELRQCIGRCIAALPPGQRVVITLRDVEGLSAGETCDVLGISEGNQRVLLHRARSRVRGLLEQELGRRAVSGTGATSR